MTLEELYQNFEYEKKTRLSQMGLKYDFTPKSVAASWISGAIQELLASAPFNYGSSTIELEDGVAEYDLPTDYGYMDTVHVGDVLYVPASINEINKETQFALNHSCYAVYADSTGDGKITLSPTPDTTGAEATLRYWVGVARWLPSGPELQDWGSYHSGSGFYSGDLMLPDQYVPAVRFYMHMQDVAAVDMKYRYERDFEREIRKINSRNYHATPTRSVYKFGI